MADDVERGLQTSAPLEDRAREHADKREVTRPAAVVGAAALVDPAHDLRIEAEPCVEGKPPAVRSAGGDVARPVLSQGVREAFGRPDRIAWQPQRARQHTGAASGHEAERQVIAVYAVQSLVEAAVAGKDDQRIRVTCLAGELDRVPRPLGAHRPDIRGPHQLPFDG